jgi:hypothetical protein
MISRTNFKAKKWILRYTAVPPKIIRNAINNK